MSRWLQGMGLLVLLALGACSKPYHPPVIEEPGQAAARSFPGLRDFLDPKTPVKVLWAHGMCTHGGDWALKRLQMAAQALRTETSLPTTPSRTDDAYTVNALIKTPRGTADISFLVWSPLTTPHKDKLAFDSSGSDPATSFPFRRASLDETLKVGIMNDCLADAVIYSGPNGDRIRAAMQREVCRALGGELDDRKGCVVPVADERPVVIITESLGSKFVFDAIREIWKGPKDRRFAARPALARRLASVSMVYMLANQIPILDLAGQAGARGPDSSALGETLQILRDARSLASGPGARRPFPSEALSVVAFSDPNDILSYRLLPHVLGGAANRLVNVITSNGWTYLGIVESPLDAHCGYGWNPYVIGALINGYVAGQPLKTAPVPEGASAKCL